MTLKEIAAFQARFDRRHHAKIPFHVEIGEKNIPDLEHLIVGLLGELGEFANLVKKVQRGDLTYRKVRAALEEELADTFIYLIKIAGQMDIDLEKAYRRKMKTNRRRFAKFLKRDRI